MIIRKKQKGFTLVELMIVIAIIGILAAVAMPMYGDYSKKAKYSAVVGMVDPVKAAVNICLQTIDSTGAECDGGKNGIPSNITSAVGDLQSLSTTNGKIKATGTSAVDNKTYELKPTVASTGITWTKSGTCIAADLC